MIMNKFLLVILSSSLVVNCAIFAQDIKNNEDASPAALAKQDLVLKKIIKEDEKLIAQYLPKKDVAETPLERFLSNIYLKVEAGSAKLAKAKDKNIRRSLKSNSAAILGFGIGTYFSESSRLELELSFINNLKFKGSAADDFSAGGISITRNRTISRKVNVKNYMANVYMDLLDFDRAKIFIGGGLGAATLKEKISLTQTVAPTGIFLPVSIAANSKKTTNFAYSLSAGVSAGLSHKVNVDVKYSFKDLGKTKSVLHGNIRLPGVKYRAHIISAAFRIDL
jgi:opacity protein-like surface antigen